MLNEIFFIWWQFPTKQSKTGDILCIDMKTKIRTMQGILCMYVCVIALGGVD